MNEDTKTDLAKRKYQHWFLLSRTKALLVPVHESVLQERGDRVDVVLAHLSNILKEEAERLEHSVLHVEFWYSVLVHERWQDSEGRAGLCDDSNGYRRAHAVLSLLHLQVVQQSSQHVVRPATESSIHYFTTFLYPHILQKYLKLEQFISLKWVVKLCNKKCTWFILKDSKKT